MVSRVVLLTIDFSSSLITNASGGSFCFSTLDLAVPLIVRYVNFNLMKSWSSAHALTAYLKFEGKFRDAISQQGI